MRWTKNSKVAAILSFIMVTAIPATSVQAEPIVIKYEGPASQNYKPGKKLQPNAKISLKPGEVLTVLDERGTRTLRGPGTFSASSSSRAASVSSTSLAALIKTSSVRRARTGAVRGESPPAQATLNPNLWFVEIGKSGKYCVADFNNLQFWRADASGVQQLTATDNMSGVNAPVKFDKGRTTARWPSTVSPKNGNSYTISIPGKAQKLKLELVGVQIADDERLDTMASKLLDRGCLAQSELLAATFAQSDPTPAGG